MSRLYKYDAFGSGAVFWSRLRCHLTFSHDWKFLDGYGVVQQCRKCGLYRIRKGWIKK